MRLVWFGRKPTIRSNFKKLILVGQTTVHYGVCELMLVNSVVDGWRLCGGSRTNRLILDLPAPAVHLFVLFTGIAQRLERFIANEIIWVQILVPVFDGGGWGSVGRATQFLLGKSWVQIPPSPLVAPSVWCDFFIIILFNGRWFKTPNR